MLHFKNVFVTMSALATGLRVNEDIVEERGEWIWSICYVYNTLVIRPIAVGHNPALVINWFERNVASAICDQFQAKPISSDFYYHMAKFDLRFVNYLWDAFHNNKHTSILYNYYLFLCRSLVHPNRMMWSVVWLIIRLIFNDVHSV